MFYNSETFSSICYLLEEELQYSVSRGEREMVLSLIEYHSR